MSEINEETEGQEEIEVSVPEEAPEEETPKDDESEGEESEGEEKPWKPKKKHSTPEWARSRFRQYSSTVRELKEQNAKLMEKMEQHLSSNKGEDKKLSKDDFPDEESYLDHLAEEKAKKNFAEYQKRQEEAQSQKEALQQLQQADVQNTQKAMQDLPDYQQVIQNGDPEVTLPRAVIDHLAISPAGPYVRYKIAADEELSEALKQYTPQQKVQAVSQLHDSILDYLSKKGASQEQTASSPSDAAPTPSTRPTGQRSKPPKAPPKQKGGTRKDLLSLDGDAYARARSGY